jgi:predicted lipoprotein with Yx(FWY)xxD motif
MDGSGACAGIRSQLGVYLTGAIHPADRPAVVRHLATCEDCRAELAGLAALPALLRRPPVQAAAQSPAIDGTAFDEAVFDEAALDEALFDEAAFDGAALDGAAFDGAALDGAALDGAGGRERGEAQLGRLLRSVARRRRRHRWLLATAALVLVAVAGTGWGLRMAEPPVTVAKADGTILETLSIGGATVLTDAEGYTLYWFGPDSATKSACGASCARQWPPVTGPAVAGTGVTGTIGAIARPDGSRQVTYDGHPLYTTAKDTGPGQTRGNGVWSGGGEWHEVTVPGRGTPANGPP